MVVASDEKVYTNEKFKMCGICFVTSFDCPSAKFHVYEEGILSTAEDKYICNHCLEFIKDLRKKVFENIKNPEKDILKDQKWWWEPEKDPLSFITKNKK